MTPQALRDELLDYQTVWWFGFFSFAIFLVFILLVVLAADTFFGKENDDAK